MSNEPISDSLARGLVEAAPDALILVNAQGLIVFVNAQGMALFGYARDELIGQPVEILIPEAARARHKNHQAGFIAAPRFRAMGQGRALSCRRRDGSEFPVEISLSPVPTAEGLYTAAAVRDITERHRAEQALLAAEEHCRLTFEEAPIGMAIVGLDGRFQRVNRSLCRILGYAPAELIGRPFVEVTHPDDRGLHLGPADELFLGGVPQYRLAKRYLRPDGRVVDAVVHVSLVRDAHGEPLHKIAQIEDVTERKLAEAALQRSEESLLRAQRIAHIGSWEWDLRSNEVTRSAEFFAIFGVSPDPRYRRANSLLDSIHPDDRAKASATFSEAARAGRGFQLEFRIVLPDGSERTVLSQGEAVIVDGRPARLVGTTLDITERKRLEQAREESLRWLRAVLDQCPVAIVLMHGPLGDRVECNRCAQALIGCTASACESGELPMYQDQTLLTGDSHPAARALRGERPTGLSLSLKTPRGELVPILLDAAPLVDDSGAVTGAVVVFQDITFLKQIDRMRAEWNSVIAHDLRQPLNAIALTAQLLARKKKDVAELARPIERIMQSTVRLDRMINDLLDLSRLEVRQLKLARRPVELASIIRSSVERSALEAPDRHVEVRGADALPALYLDADRITQVLDNLLSNAVKYGDPESPIHITVDGGATEVTVAVTNTGAGIAAEDLPRLFQRFQRVSESSHGAVKGIGLGLYIVQQLVEAHGGRIRVESTPGETTTFRFTLPCCDPQPAAATAVPPA